MKTQSLALAVLGIAVTGCGHKEGPAENHAAAPVAARPGSTEEPSVQPGGDSAEEPEVQPGGVAAHDGKPCRIEKRYSAGVELTRFGGHLSNTEKES